MIYFLDYETDFNLNELNVNQYLKIVFWDRKIKTLIILEINPVLIFFKNLLS